MVRCTENFKAPGFREAAGPPPPTDKTVIIINVFSLNYMMYVEGGKREGEKTTKGETSGEMGDEGEETNQMDVAVNVKVWEGEK